jgi:hypothetical protein
MVVFMVKWQSPRYRRAKEFIAYSLKERLKHLHLAHEGKRPTRAEKSDTEEIERDAKR